MSSSFNASDTSPEQLEQLQSTGFTYAPLPEGGDTFRLLRILPSLHIESQIRCELFVASIKKYENKHIAGSYVWGTVRAIVLYSPQWYTLHRAPKSLALPPCLSQQVQNASYVD
jgi:hypothetical protein